MADDDKKRKSSGGGSKSGSKSSGKKSTSKKSSSSGKTTSARSSSSGGSSDSVAVKAGRAVAKKIGWKARIIITVLVGVILGVSMIWENRINVALGLTKQTDTGEYKGQTNAEVVAAAKDKGALNVHFVDVGQGDACIVELPDDKKMLIDCADGKTENTNAVLDYIDKNIKTKDGKTMDKFDYVILTHSDSDHCGSMADVLDKYPAVNFYRPNVAANYKDKKTGEVYVDPSLKNMKDYRTKDTRAYKNAIEAGCKNAENVYVNSVNLDPIVADDKDNDGNPDYDYKLSFYGPNRDNYTDWNNYSPIMILEFGDKRFALTGDCEKEGEAEFVEKVGKAKGKSVEEDKFAVFTDDFTVDVIKAGHHGSRTSTSSAFIEAITTKNNIGNVLMVISCGFGNSYGHPHQEKLEQFRADGIKDENVLRTDRNGSIVLSVHADAAGEFQLFHGANAVVRAESTSVDWRYIAICIFAVVFLILIVEPLIRTLTKKAKRK